MIEIKVIKELEFFDKKYHYVLREGLIYRKWIPPLLSEGKVL